MGLKLAIFKRRLINTGFVWGDFVVLSRLCEGPRKNWVCSLMFLMLTKGKIVRAETLRCAQSDGKNASGSAIFVVKSETLRCAQRDRAKVICC